MPDTHRWLRAVICLALVGTAGSVSSGHSETKGQGHWSLEIQTESIILKVGYLKHLH